MGSCEFVWPACILGLMNAIVDSHELNFMMLAVCSTTGMVVDGKRIMLCVTFGGDEL
jgi:hypothetical protein